MSNNSDKIKSEVEWLKHDVIKNDYQIIKSGRSVLNLPKHELYSTSHSSIVNYNINVKNNYPENHLTQLNLIFIVILKCLN